MKLVGQQSNGAPACSSWTKIIPLLHRMPPLRCPAPLVHASGLNVPYSGMSSVSSGASLHVQSHDHRGHEWLKVLLHGILQVNWEVVETSRGLNYHCQSILIVNTTPSAKIRFGVRRQLVMTPVNLFHKCIDLTCEFLGSPTHDFALMTSDAVEVCHILR